MAWISGNRALTEDEMRNNAEIVRGYLMDEYGWSINAVCGLLGNMESESYINPGVWENFEENKGGFGLVQWTPYTKYTDWAEAMDYDWDDGNGQLIWIEEETVPTGQWSPTPDYNFSFETFKTSTETPEYLASAFLYNFEKPKHPEDTINARQNQARKWYDRWHGITPDTPPGGYPVFKKRKGFNFLLFCRRRREQRWH